MQAARNRETIVIDHDRAEVDESNPVEPSMKGTPQAALLSALWDRYALVKVLQRDGRGEWQVSASSQVHAERLADGRDGQAGAASDVLAWVADGHRSQVRVALECVARGQPDWQGECETDPRCGLPRWLELHISPLSAPQARFDQVLQCLVTGRECAGKKRAEVAAAEVSEHWALAAVAAGLGTISYDIGARVLKLDDIAAQHHGLRPGSADGLPLDMWVTCLAEADRLKAHALLISEPAPGRTDSLSVTIQSMDGHRNRVLDLAFRCTADRSRLIGTCRDVTQERTIEEMRRKKLAAERASKAKSEFMSQVSHELRTPLNGILGFAQVMLMDQLQPLPEEQYKRAEMVLYSGRRLLSLIDQLLEISKIEQGKRALQIRSVNVASVVRRSIEQVQPMADQAGIEIEAQFDRPDKTAMRCDPGALEQVMVNLLSNAIKYNRPNGRVRVRIDTATPASVVVEDTGRGISESEIGRLFEPFNRLSAQGSTVQGNGLGLVISRRLVEAMSGELRVVSKVGVGSRFSVHLPLAAHSRFDAGHTLPMDMPSQWDAARQQKVLYIEDDEVNILLMEQVFSTQPAWNLLVAMTGQDGIRMAVQHRPDVILLDLNLPDMSGHQVFQALRKDPRTARTPCVAVSADALPAQVRRALADGFDDYWVKPMDLSSVIAKLKAMLRAAQLESFDSP